jgi:hypothetical protein
VLCGRRFCGYALDSAKEPPLDQVPDVHEGCGEANLVRLGELVRTMLPTQVLLLYLRDRTLSRQGFLFADRGECVAKGFEGVGGGL